MRGNEVIGANDDGMMGEATVCHFVLKDLPAVVLPYTLIDPLRPAPPPVTPFPPNPTVNLAPPGGAQSQY